MAQWWYSVLGSGQTGGGLMMRAASGGHLRMAAGQHITLLRSVVGRLLRQLRSDAEDAAHAEALLPRAVAVVHPLPVGGREWWIEG